MNANDNVKSAIALVFINACLWMAVYFIYKTLTV